MIVFLLGLLSCISDQMIVHEVEREIEIIVEVPSECEVIEETIIIEDTAFDFSDIWVDSLTQIGSMDGVDIFWVIDPSGSMTNDEPQILAGISHMMASLPETGWRLMILPTDHRYVGSLSTFPIIPGDRLSDVENMYSQHVVGHMEAGFDALYEYIIFNSYSSTWLRSDAALLVVFVSDEEEQSNSYLQDAPAFINWIQGIRSNVFVASIVNVEPADSVCAMTPSALTTGRRYMDVADHFFGNIIDICSEDWSAGVADAAVQLTPYEWIDLTHIPLDPNWIYVYVDGSANIDWYYDAADNRVYFTAVPRENSLVEVVYNY
tara:strand:- start:10717 stop:11676 length:960 start_codon:yes stop_codon:yes gene_type:complete